MSFRRKAAKPAKGRKAETVAPPVRTIASLPRQRGEVRWRVAADVLFPRFWALTFLDAWGFRFYAPAVMTALLGPREPGECLSQWFLCNLSIARNGTVKGVPFDELFNARQRAALVRFLKYLIHHRAREFGGDSDAARRLIEIQSRTSLERH